MSKTWELFEPMCGDGEGVWVRSKVMPDCSSAPTSSTDSIRKGRPVATGVLQYFPDAIDAIAEVSRRGNEQHSPGQPLHWAREKSTDQLDAAVRHLMDYLRGKKRDDKGNLALAQAAWRVLAQLQLDLEGEGS